MRTTGPDLVLAVASVFHHPEGQACWWESYRRRDAAGRAELVADLERRIDRQPDTPSDEHGG